MILHIFHDHNFLHFTQLEFEKCTEQSKYVILSEQAVIAKGCVVLNNDALVDLIHKENFSRIIIHNLTGQKAKPIIESGYQGAIHWSAWGNDIYHSGFGFSPNQLLEKETLAFLKANDIKVPKPSVLRSNKKLKEVFFWFYHLIKKTRHPSDWVNKLLPKITSFSTVIPLERNDVKAVVKNADYLPFTYGNLSDLIPESEVLFDFKKLGKQICVGNSATAANNHISVFNKIKNKPLLIPFVYGDKAYKASVLRTYQSEASFEFVLDRLAYADYLNTLKKANTMVINTLRQQGLGTIILGLHLGMRLYLNKKNPTFTFLQSLNIHVFDFESEFEKFENKPLTAQEVMENRKGLIAYWGVDAAAKRMKDF